MKGYHKGIRDQILEAMPAGIEMRTAEIAASVNGTRQKVSGALKALVKSGEIEKVKCGVYRKPEVDEPLLNS